MSKKTINVEQQMKSNDNNTNERNDTIRLIYICKQHPVAKIPSFGNRNVTAKSQIMRTIPQTVVRIFSRW